jgi:twitching motility protein PilT
MQINKLLQTVISQGASDLHIAVGVPPCIRLHGRLVHLKTKVLTPEDTVSLMKSITPERCQQELQESGSTDFGFGFENQARFRVAVFRERHQVGIVLRLIPSRIMTFEEIGLPPQIKMLMYRPRGLFLVTGPTGSGKTTSLATMLEHINRNRETHIITIEDPIEYYHTHNKSIITQRELGVDVPSFSEGLRRALRQDPDVILVGEMRDLETISTAITAAETGHLVFATLHTTGCQGTINRVVDVYPEREQEQVRVQLSVTLICVISQALIPRASGQGRVAAFEIMVMTPAIANLIRMQKVYQIDSEIQTGSRLGMISLDKSLLNLYAQGVIARPEVLARCRNIVETTEAMDRMLVGEGAPRPAQAAVGEDFVPPVGSGK